MITRSSRVVKPNLRAQFRGFLSPLPPCPGLPDAQAGRPACGPEPFGGQRPVPNRGREAVGAARIEPPETWRLLSYSFRRQRLIVVSKLPEAR